MLNDSVNHIKDSLAGNNGKICHVKTEDHRLTDILNNIIGLEIRQNGPAIAWAFEDAAGGNK